MDTTPEPSVLTDFVPRRLFPLYTFPRAKPSYR